MWLSITVCQLCDQEKEWVCFAAIKILRVRSSSMGNRREGGGNSTRFHITLTNVTVQRNAVEAKMELRTRDVLHPHIRWRICGCKTCHKFMAPTTCHDIYVMTSCGCHNEWMTEVADPNISPFRSIISSWRRRSTVCSPSKATSVPFKIWLNYISRSQGRKIGLRQKYVDLLRGCGNHVKSLTVDVARFRQKRTNFAEGVFRELM